MVYDIQKSSRTIPPWKTASWTIAPGQLPPRRIVLPPDSYIRTIDA